VTAGGCRPGWAVRRRSPTPRRRWTPTSGRPGQASAFASATRASGRFRRGGKGRPKEERGARLKQLRAAFQLTRKNDPKLVPYLLGAFLLGLAISLGIGALTGYERDTAERDRRALGDPDTPAEDSRRSGRASPGS